MDVVPSTELLVLQAVVAGRYAVDREIGRGGMGIVCRARDLALERTVQRAGAFPPLEVARVLGPVPRARAPMRLPVVLTPEEVRRVLEQMQGTTRLATLLLYGSGMRLLECLTLRVKDIDRSGNGRWCGHGSKRDSETVPEAGQGRLKTLAFGFGLCIAAVGALGMLAPAGLAWVALRFVSSGAFAFYIVALIRIAFGLSLVLVASASRAPRAIRLVGYVIVILGLTTGLMGLLEIDRAHDSIGWWLKKGTAIVRLTGVAILVFGGFVAYACAPARRRPN